MQSVNVTELHYVVNEILENVDNIDDTFFVENTLINYVSSLCDRKREEIYSIK